MPGYRPWAERELLKAEAEMRVRSGQSRADVARELGVPINTLAQWACQGGWRKKDLEEDWACKRVQQTGRRIMALRSRDRERADRLQALMAEMEALLASDRSAPRRLSPPKDADWLKELPGAHVQRERQIDERKAEEAAHMPPEREPPSPEYEFAERGWPESDRSQSDWPASGEPESGNAGSSEAEPGDVQGDGDNAAQVTD